MAVFNGQPVDSFTTNSAFMSRTQDTDTVGKVSLLNTGSDLIDDTQAYINKIAQSDGITSETDTTNLNYSSNEIVADGDNRKVAIGKLDASLGLTNLTVDDHETRLDTAELEINILQSDLTAHTSNTSNPHATTAAQVGADPAGTASSAVAAHVAAADPHSQYLTSTEGDAAYLKRTANDFTTFTEKTTPIAADVMLIEDSEASFAKKKITLTNLLGGGSGGDINFISNSAGSTGTTGWVTGSYAAAARPSGAFTASSGSGAFAISTTTTSPLGVGTTSFLLTKSSGASRQGRAIQYEFDLPLDYRAKVLSLDIHYIVNSGTFVAGSTGVDSSLIWYTSFSSDGTNFTVSEPSSFKCLSNSTTISDQFKAEVQSPSDAIKMRLIAYVAESATTAWEIKTIFAVSPSKYVFGTPITDWQSYTPTWNNVSGASDAKYRRVGDSVQIFSRIALTGAVTGTVTLNLPSGLSIDTSKLSSGIGANDILPNGSGSAIVAGTFGSPLLPCYNNTTSIIIRTYQQRSTDDLQIDNITSTVPATWVSGDMMQVSFFLPILGWSSSVQMSDSVGNSREIIAYGQVCGSQVVTSGTTAQLNNGTSSVTYDTAGIMSSNQIKIPSAGWYTVNGQYQATINYASGSSYTQLLVNKNGSIIYTLDSTQASGVSTVNNYWPQRFSPPTFFNAGDILTLHLVNQSGNTLTVSFANFGVQKSTNPNTIAATEKVNLRYNSSTTSIPSFAETKYILSVKSYDSHNAYNTTTGVFTAPIAGKYKFNHQVYFSTVTGASLTILSAYKNSETTAFSYGPIAFVSLGNESMCAHNDTVYLLAGETLNFRVYQDSPLTRSLGVGSFNNSRNYLAIEKVD